MKPAPSITEVYVIKGHVYQYHLIPDRFYVCIKQAITHAGVIGPNYRTKKHAEKAAKRLRKALGLI